MEKEIRNKKPNGEWHGYQQLWSANEKLWHRGSYKNDLAIGYHEVNLYRGGIGDKDTEVEFYIR